MGLETEQDYLREIAKVKSEKVRSEVLRDETRQLASELGVTVTFVNCLYPIDCCIDKKLSDLRNSLAILRGE